MGNGVQPARTHSLDVGSVDVGPPNMVKSGEEGEGLTSPPSSSGRTAHLLKFATALNRLCETCVFIGTLAHYEEFITRDLLIDLTEELNTRTAEVLDSTGEMYPWHTDVDVVFEEVHEAAKTALQCLRKGRPPVESNSSGSRYPDKGHPISSPRRSRPQ